MTRCLSRSFKYNILILIIVFCFALIGCSNLKKKEFGYIVENSRIDSDNKAQNGNIEGKEDIGDDNLEDYSDDFDLSDDSDILYIQDASLDNKYLEEFYNLAPTARMSFEEIVGDNGIYDIPEGFPAPDTYKLIVDLHYQVVLAYKKDDNGEYTIPVRYMICSTGASSTPSPTGTYEMKDYKVRYALFNNTNVYGQYWSRITGRIYFHSLLYTAIDASTYTESSYRNLGKHVSHGCIRLTVPDARWIWFNCAPGTIVQIREGSSSDKATAVIREQLSLPPLPVHRPESIPPETLPMTDNWTIDEVPHEVGFVQGHQ